MPMSKEGPFRALEVINLIPNKLLDDLSDQTDVDYSVQKLHGKTIFQLFLFTLLEQGQLSLRILEAVFASKKFQTLFQIQNKTVKHSAIGMRLQNVNYRYFEAIFQYLTKLPDLKETFSLAGKKIQTHKIDSTFVGIAEKLIAFGMRNGKGTTKKHLKYTINLSGGIPVDLKLYSEKSAVSEDIALPALIQSVPKTHKKDSCIHVALFDQGIRKKQTFLSLVKNNILFVSRSHSHTFHVIESLPADKQENDHMEILSDQIVQFSKKKTGKRLITFPEHLRLVIGKTKKEGKPLHFLTNISFLSALEISELYRSRWEIETFFKFIKQELGFSHLLSRSQNGLLAVMYLTMIAAILLILYKKKNRISGWKVAKIRFLDELQLIVFETWHKQICLTEQEKGSFFEINSS